MRFQLLYGRGLADAEFCSASAVDPETTIVDAPGLTLDAGGAADLAVELNVAAAAGVTPVSATVVGGAGNDLWWGWSWGRAISSAAKGEVGAAATVDPETATVDAPGLIANARGSADLTDELGVATVADGAPVSAAVVGRAGDGLRLRAVASAAAEGEVCAASAVDPEAAVVDAPGLAANAGGAADLTDELGVARSTDVAPVAFAIVGGAGNALLVVAVTGLRVRRGGKREGCGEEECSDEEKFCRVCHLVLFSEFKSVDGAGPLLTEDEDSSVWIACLVFRKEIV